jgi:hypothetical protein
MQRTHKRTNAPAARHSLAAVPSHRCKCGGRCCACAVLSFYPACPSALPMTLPTYSSTTISLLPLPPSFTHLPHRLTQPTVIFTTTTLHPPPNSLDRIPPP